jgi:3-methyladenine DNA glycosylase AlkD
VSSPVSARANAFVAEHRDEAGALASRLGGLVDRPDLFVAETAAGFRALADPAYRAELERMVPGLGAAYGVRSPLLAPVHAAVRRACRGRPDEALWLAERVSAVPELEVRGLARTLLRAAIETDPERSWQQVRGLARSAANWVDVDGLASVTALGVLLEPFRWAELGQLVYSPSAWERRLVASTIATLPFEVVPADRSRLATGPALDLLEQLLGDADAYVQKALSWAIRSWARVDPAGIERFVADQAALAADTRDGHRAWVLRDAVGALAPETAATTRQLLAGLRRAADEPPTSRASAAAGGFATLIGTTRPGDRPAPTTERSRTA